jgi:hypothetical protein
MNNLTFFPFFPISGYSTDFCKRAVYEKLHNAKAQQCIKQRSYDCTQQESYEDDQRRLGELEQKVNIPSS